MPLLTDEEKVAEDKAAEDKAAAEEKAAHEALYPKSDEEKAAEKKAEEDKANEGKTDEEIAAEKKIADDKLATEKADAEKVASEKKASEAKLEQAKAEGLATAEDLKFPEGIKVNEVVQEKFLTLVNDKDMKPVDRAQALIGLQQELYTAQAEAHQEQVAQWVKDVEVDKEIIGDTGDKMDENLAISKKGMEALKVEGLAKLLEDTGFGSHPLFVKAFYRIGKAVSEDTFIVGGKGGSSEVKSQAQILYGNNEKK